MSDAVDRAVAAMAGRLADLLARALPDGGQLADGQAFLHAMAGAVPPAAAPGTADEATPLGRLRDGLGLAPVEVDVLVLAGLAEEHEGCASLLRSLHPRGEPFATTGLAAQLLCGDAAERRLLRAVLESGAAVRAGAVRVEDGPPFPERTLRVADSLWSALHGLDAWPAAVRRQHGPAPAAGLARWLAAPACRRAALALREGLRCTILLTADSEEVAANRAAALADAAGCAAVRVTNHTSGAGGADAAGADFERLTTVHALARGVVPIVSSAPPEDAGTAPVLRFTDYPGPIILCARNGAFRLRGGRPVLPVAAERLRPLDRRDMWRELLPELDAHAAALATQYAVEPAAAAAAAADARALAALDGRAPAVGDVALGISTRNAVVGAAGIRLIRPKAGWDDLVLPHDRMLQLRESLDRLLHQVRVLDEWGLLNGRPGAHGVRMLFAGPPGTGKTLAAEVLARELGVDLLLVDIARVVSKWIGETEKNLAAVFDAAEQAQAVLFFDEADALFGKRTEVTDAHDRYANLETAYLLNRLERFDGLAILSTNLRNNIDPAFIRRLEFIVEFDEPNLADRNRLWRCHLPATAPLAADADLHELATLYPVVGGLIRNAAVAAAFRAAAEDTAITRAQLIRAVRREYDKAGRAFPGAPWGLDDS
jgi:hypothetical protein